MPEDVTSPITTTRRAVATLVTPAMRAAPGGRRQVALMALGLEKSHGLVLAERGAALAKKPASVPAPDEEGDDEEIAVSVSPDGGEVSFDLDAALGDFVQSMLDAVPVAGESAEDRIGRAKQLRSALQNWVESGQPGAPMAASAHPGGNLTQRTLAMVRASKKFAGMAYDEQFQEAVRLVRAGAVI
jgi:hypothetical protein